MLLGVLQEGVVVEAQIARLQVALAGAGLGRDDLAVGDVHEDAVDIGELPSGAVDAMEIGVALEDEAIGGRPRLEHPGLERGKVGVVVAIGVVEPVVERHPVALLALLDELRELVLVGVFRMELLQVMRRLVEIERAWPGERRQEQRVGVRPAVADCQRVGELDTRLLAFWQQLTHQPGGREFGIERDVFVPVAEILRGEGFAIRPFMAFSEMEGEDPILVDIDGFGEIGGEGQVRRVADEAGIAVHHHEPRILGARHQHAQVAARPSGRLAGNHRLARNALRDRRDGAARHRVGEARRLDENRRLIGRRREAGQRQEQGDCKVLHCAASLIVGKAVAWT